MTLKQIFGEQSIKHVQYQPQTDPPHPPPPILMESCGKIFSPKIFLEFHKTDKNWSCGAKRACPQGRFHLRKSVNKIFSNQFIILRLPDTQDYARFCLASVNLQFGVPRKFTQQSHGVRGSFNMLMFSM